MSTVALKDRIKRQTVHAWRGASAQHVPNKCKSLWCFVFCTLQTEPEGNLSLQLISSYFGIKLCLEDINKRQGLSAASGHTPSSFTLLSHMTELRLCLIPSRFCFLKWHGTIRTKTLLVKLTLESLHLIGSQHFHSLSPWHSKLVDWIRLGLVNAKFMNEE